MSPPPPQYPPLDSLICHHLTKPCSAPCLCNSNAGFVTTGFFGDVSFGTHHIKRDSELAFALTPAQYNYKPPPQHQDATWPTTTATQPVQSTFPTTFSTPCALLASVAPLPLLPRQGASCQPPLLLCEAPTHVYPRTLFERSCAVRGPLLADHPDTGCRYGATKAFLTTFGSTLAAEVRHEGIDVLVVRAALQHVTHTPSHSAYLPSCAAFATPDASKPNQHALLQRRAQVWCPGDVSQDSYDTRSRGSNHARLSRSHRCP